MVKGEPLKPLGIRECTTHTRPPCAKCQKIECDVMHDDLGTNCHLQSCDVCTEFAQLDVQISKAHERLSNLVQKRQDMKKRLNDCHDLLTNRLPPELISRIFIVVDAELMKEWRLYRIFSPALLLGSICKRWRDIAFETPQLWTTVNIQPWKHVNKLDITKAWLRRSRSLPLTVTIHGGEPYVLGNSAAPSTLKPLFDVLRLQSSRWKQIAFDQHMPWYILHGLFHEVEDIPPLEALHAYIMRNNLDPIRTSQPLRPKEFYVGNVSIRKMSLEWNNLTTLNLCTISIDELVQIIRHGTKLTFCDVAGVISDKGGYPLPDTPIVNTSMEHLKIDGLTDDANFLQYTTFPSLKFLHYDDFEHCNSALETLSSFLERSAAFLREFIFEYDTDGGTDPLWFEYLPGITRLKISFEDDDSASLMRDTLFDKLSKSSTLPALRDLVICTRRMKPSSWSLFSKIFQPEPGEEPYATLEAGVIDANVSEVDTPTNWPRRPLKSVYIDHDAVLQKQEGIMHELVYQRLLDAQSSGTKFTFLNGDGMDILDLVGEIPS
ncbi:hypothetical protein CVT25_008589 [Psilocybe cyanescens]|uniref:Uncharacterized protein n=1 Tax=Psilocybe cyanescens TaxID=93625 RepID=A0A409XNJ6_PSICY|nr:hypothetical protein CVT25_008589 [Psilocybe cyanescens]